MVMLVTGKADPLAVLNRDMAPDSFVLLWAAMILPGAFLAALPGRLHHREGSARPTLSACLTALAGGLLLVLGLGMAGSNVLAGLFQGSVSAYAFLLSAWLSAFLLLRLTRRRA